MHHLENEVTPVIALFSTKHTHTQFLYLSLTHTVSFFLSHTHMDKHSRWRGVKQAMIWLELDGRHSLKARGRLNRISLIQC